MTNRFSVVSTHLLLVVTIGTASGETYEVPAGQRQLFLDDVGIEKSANLKRTMHQPTKKGAVLRPTFPKESSIQIRCPPAWDPREKVYKIWYNCSDGTKYGHTGLAKSEDGIHWTKVALDNVSLNPDIPSVRAPFNAVYDATDPDLSRRFKGMGHARGREPFVSANGIDWTPLAVPSIPSQDESNMSLDEANRLFILTVKHGGPNGRSVHLSTSKDFEKWTKPKLMFHADDLDQKLGRENITARFADKSLQQPVANDPSRYNVDVYNMGVFRYESLYIGMPALYHATGPAGNNTDGFQLVQLACSRDLVNWKRLGERRPFIGPSPIDAGAYDLTQILPPSDAIVHGDELWFYYTGSKYRRRPKVAEPDAGAVCLAVLRRDGFISLDAGKEEGWVLTKPFVLHGTKLFMNFAGDEGGELHVEVLNGNGDVTMRSAALSGDLRRWPVRWSQGDLADLQDQTMSLRFTLRSGRLFSYWFE